MPLIHLLSSPDVSVARVVCGAPIALVATWDRRMASCPACLMERPPCACGPTSSPCPACRAYGRTHRAGGSRRPGPLFRTEAAFQEAIRQEARTAGWLYFHCHDSRKSPAGFVDCTLVRDGRLVLAELKMSGQRPTAAQAAWLGALGQVREVSTFLWTPDDLATILEVLQ